MSPGRLLSALIAGLVVVLGRLLFTARWNIDRFWAGVLCQSAFEGSFAAEIIRDGILGVDKGQYEAADAIGFSRGDKYRFIVIPQSLPLILPPLTGLIISLIKHSAIVSVIAVEELATAGRPARAAG